MKKFICLLFVSASMLLCSCVTKVMVDSPEFPVATYDDLTNDFSAKLKAPLASVFKATNLALERDMGFFRCGQIPKDREWFIYARAKRDIQMVVNLKDEGNGVVNVIISYGDDDLVLCQKLFKAITKNLKAYQ